MISHRHRCIYIKVPKCASTTILHWFLDHCRAERSMRPWWYGRLQSERIEAVAQAMNLYPDYFTFSFVRNLYRRFVSLWRSTLRNSSPRFPALREGRTDRLSMRAFAELCGELLDDFGPRWGGEARAFFRDNAGRRYGPGGIALRHLGWVIDHARPQTEFLPDCQAKRLFGVVRANRDPLSFIGRVENLDADFERLRRILALPGAAVGHRNASVGPDGPGRPWRSHYDDATRRLVEEIYAADLEFTGCGFDGGPATPPAAMRPARRRGARGSPAHLARRLWSLEIPRPGRPSRFPRRLRRHASALWAGAWAAPALWLAAAAAREAELPAAAVLAAGTLAAGAAVALALGCAPRFARPLSPDGRLPICPSSPWARRGGGCAACWRNWRARATDEEDRHPASGAAGRPGPRRVRRWAAAPAPGPKARSRGAGEPARAIPGTGVPCGRRRARRRHRRGG